LFLRRIEIAVVVKLRHAIAKIGVARDLHLLERGAVAIVVQERI
jgi:hypothetical protein